MVLSVCINSIKYYDDEDDNFQAYFNSQIGIW